MPDLLQNKRTGEYGYRLETGDIIPAEVARNKRTGEIGWRPKGSSDPWQAYSAPSEAVSRETPLPKGDGYEEGLARTVASNVLGGAGSEVAGLVGAGYGGIKAAMEPSIPWSRVPDVMRTMYESEEARARGLENQFMEQNPATGMAAAIGGAVASPLMRPLMAISAPVKGAGIAANTGRVALGGGAGAGLYGATQAAPGQRIEGMATGAALGAGVGAVAAPVVSGISALGRGARSLAETLRVPGLNQETAAARKTMEALMRDGLTPDQALARVTELGPEAALLDVGPNARALARSAYTVPGEGKTKIGEFLTARQEGARGSSKILEGGQAQRIISKIDDLVPQRYRGTLDQLTAQRAKSAAPLYNEAFAPVSNLEGKVFAQWDERLQQFLDDPIVRKGMEKGIRVQQLEALAEGKPFNFQEYAVKGFDDAGNLIIEGTPNLRAMDAAKRGLDNILEGYRDKVTGRLVLDDMGRAIESVRKSLVNKLDDITTDQLTGRSAYKEARAAYAGPSKMRDALATGRQVLGGKFKNVDEMRNRIKDMSPDELNYMRIGAVQELRDKIGGTVARADATKKLMDVPDLEQKIRLAFGDDEMFKRYISGLENERAMFEAYSAIKGGSRTGEVLAEQVDATVDPGRIAGGLQRMISPNPLDWVSGGVQALGGAKDRILMPERQSGALANILLGRDISPLARQAQAQQMSQQARERLSQSLRRGLVPYAGGAAGRSYSQ